MKKLNNIYKTKNPTNPASIRNLFVKDDFYINTPLEYEYVKNFLIQYFNFKDNDEFIKNFYNNKYIPLLIDYKYLPIIKSRKPYNLGKLFNIESRTTLKRDYWLDRGYNEDDINNYFKNRQATTRKKLDKLIFEYGEEDGRKKFKEQYKDVYKRVSTKNKENYKNRIGYPYSKTINPDTGNFYTREESNVKINKMRAEHAKETRKHRATSIFQKEYWIDKGLDTSAAIEMVRSKMAHNCLSYYIERFGVEEGTIRYNKRIEKYKNTCNNKPIDEILEWNKKKYSKNPKISKASKLFFDKCIECAKNLNLEIKEYMYYDKEFYLYDLEYSTIYFYDFYDKDDNLLIEYNGIVFHPKYNNMTTEELKKWKSVYYNIDGITQMNRDKRKEEFAKIKGYNFITIWEDDSLDYALNKIINKIKEIRNVN